MKMKMKIKIKIKINKRNIYYFMQNSSVYKNHFPFNK
jgi:hypothetical protein